MSDVERVPNKLPMALDALSLTLLSEENARLRISLADAERHLAQIERALARRVVIGQAQGLLMERTGVSEEQAIAYLKRASMHLNRKLFDIAAEIMQTRQLPTFDQ